MNHAGGVSVRQRVGQLTEDVDRVRKWQCLLAFEPGSKGLSFDERHHIEQESVCRTGIEERQDMRMVQMRGCANLSNETVRAYRCGEFRLQYVRRLTLARVQGD